MSVDELNDSGDQELTLRDRIDRVPSGGVRVQVAMG